MARRIRRSPKDSCVACRKPLEMPGAVWSGERGPLCPPCHNDSIARQMGLRFDNARLDPVTMEDHARRPHTFQIVSHLVPTGHAMKAIEVGVAEGYEFAVLGDFEEDALVLCARLCEVIRAGLARRSLDPMPDGAQVLAKQAVARITCAAQTYEPLVVIDGRAFTWEEFGRMILTYEGWTLAMSFADGIEFAVGPHGRSPRLGA